MHASSSAITAGKYSHDFRMKRIEFWWNPLLLVLIRSAGPVYKKLSIAFFLVARFQRYPELSRDVPYSVSRMAAFGCGR